MPAGLERYGASIKEYLLAGGSAPSDEEKANVIMTRLPADHGQDDAQRLPHIRQAQGLRVGTRPPLPEPAHRHG